MICMDRYGKITFYLNESYCQIEINEEKKQRKFYKFNKKESLIFFKEITNYKDLFYINKHQNKNTIILKEQMQLNKILEIIQKRNLHPKKTIHKAKKEFLVKLAAVVTAVTISTSGLLTLKNTQKSIKDNTSKKINTSSIDNTDEQFFDKVFIPKTELEKQRLNELKDIEEVINKKEKEHKDEELKQQQELEQKKEEEISISEEVINNFDLKDTNINDFDYELYNNVVDKYYTLFEKYGKMYGIDPNLIAIIACQESGGNHEKEVENNTAIGLCQIEKEWSVVDVLKIPENEFVAEKANDYLKEKVTKVYNYETNSYDYLVGVTEYSFNTFKYFGVEIDSKYTILNLKNVEDNIRMCTGILAYNLKELDGNLFATLISYNQGLPEVKKYLKIYSDELGIPVNEVIKRNDWVKLIPIEHGDPNYHNNVLKFAIAGSNEIHCISGKGDIKDCTLKITGNNIKEINKTK